MPIALDPLLLAGICAGSTLAGAWIAHKWLLHKSAGARGSERLAPTLELGPQPTSVAPGPDPELALAARPFASAIERELAEIVSGVESGAYRLMESAAQADARAAAADNLWLAVRRLRHFHDKVAAFVEPPPATEEPYEVEALLTELRRELEHARLGLEISWTLPAMLPPLLGGQEALLDTLLCTCHALLQLEPSALRLSIEAEPRFEESIPFVELALQVEYDEDPVRRPTATKPSIAFTIARTAAENLARRHSGEIAFEHDQGHRAGALLRLPAGSRHGMASSTAETVPVDAAPATSSRRHAFGGVLMLEGDPTVRALLANELKACGRAVFACADGAAVRSLMQATPKRFELLVVDRPSRLDRGDAELAVRLCPDLKVFVLSDITEDDADNLLIRRAHRLKKPFGLQDLRRALREALSD
jgi:CheY-like chemotaxis protein